MRKVEPLTEAPQVAEGEVVAEEQAIERYKMMRRDAVFAMPPVEFLVDGLITDTGFTMMYGAPGTGKSFIAIDIALSVAHGQAWQGQGVKQGPVLYIAGEGIGGFGKRWKGGAASRKVDEPDLYLPTVVNFREPEYTRASSPPSRISISRSRSTPPIPWRAPSLAQRRTAAPTWACSSPHVTRSRR